MPAAVVVFKLHDISFKHKNHHAGTLCVFVYGLFA